MPSLIRMTIIMLSSLSAPNTASDRLIALQAEAFLKMPFAMPADAEVSDVLTNGIALVSALLSSQDSSQDLQENKRRLASQVMEKMHQIAREKTVDSKHRTYPCFSC